MEYYVRDGVLGRPLNINWESCTRKYSEAQLSQLKLSGVGKRQFRTRYSQLKVSGLPNIASLQGLMLTRSVNVSDA